MTVPVPKEALEWFRAKGLTVGFSHQDVWAEEHAAAFTVAKAMRLDILQGIREAMDTAIEQGQTFRDFAKGLEPLLVKQGWWGRADMADPLTGEIRDVQLGSLARLRTIYDSNLRTANAAGQWQRIQASKATHPFLLYQLGPSREHRPEHKAWDGLLLPVDATFWQRHYPPNGWGCKCWVRAVSRREAERMRAAGQVIEQAPEDKPVEYVNQRTGEVRQGVAGIEPGWEYNPGAAPRLQQPLLSLEEKMARSDPALVRVTVKLKDGEVLGEWMKSPRGRFPLGWLSESAPAIGGVESRVVVTSATSKLPNISPDDWALIQPALDEGVVVAGDAGDVLFVRPAGDMVAVMRCRKIEGQLHVIELRRLSDVAAAKDPVIKQALKG